MIETYLRWQPVPDVAVPFAYIVLNTEPADYTALLRFSQVRASPRRDLLLRFGRQVLACASHNEFVHPWQRDRDSGEVPRLEGEWASYAFPLLEVRSSKWIASFSDSQILDFQREGARHFRLVSLDNTVDVLTTGPVAAEWVPTAP